MFTRRRIVIGAAVAVLVPAAAFGWWLLSPLFIDKTVEEEFPLSFRAIVPADMSQKDVEVEMETAEETEVRVGEPMPGDMPDGATAVRVKSGSFEDADRFHKGEGEATIYRGPDGSFLLRLENFKVTNGPDLHVLLSPHPDPRNREHVMTEGYVDVSAVGSVIIYCKPFHVLFSAAPLKSAE